MPVLTRWVTQGDITKLPCITIEARARVSVSADAKVTILTLSKVTDITLPAWVAEAEVGMNADPVHAVRQADRSEAVNAGPTFIALAALAIVLVVVKEAGVEEINARSSDKLGRLDRWIIQKVFLFLNIIAVLFVKAILDHISAARPGRALVLQKTTAWEVKLFEILIVNNLEVGVDSAVKIDCFHVTH